MTVPPMRNVIIREEGKEKNAYHYVLNPSVLLEPSVQPETMQRNAVVGHLYRVMVIHLAQSVSQKQFKDQSKK